MRAILALGLILALAPGAYAQERRPSEDEIFGPGSGVEDLTRKKKGAKKKPTTPSRTFTLGGMAYLRLQSYVSWEGAFEKQRFAMPNLLDLYLDARPDPRVRAFASGRLLFDPTVSEGDVDLLGLPAVSQKVLLDQLWIKTDIARSVFLTLGNQRIKWGASRIWNPTDFLNRRHRDPLAFFDTRTGVTLLKVHIPIEKLGWNVYAIGLFDGANALENIGGALRLEMVFGEAEFGLSAVAGAGRKTGFGFDVSAGLGPIDIYAEASLTDERGSTHYTGELDLSDPLLPILPTTHTRNAYYGRVSAGLMATFKTSTTDHMVIGAEYFFNPLGTADKRLYPWLIAQGQFEPFYLGKHYAALFWLIPSPGSWDEATFTTSTLANLSDMSFVSRIDFSLRIHRMLRLEAFVMIHYGKPGGEFRFEIDVPDLPDLPVPPGHYPAPMVDFGIHLRVAM